MTMKKRAQLAQSLYADVVGLPVDYESGVYTRLAGARGRSAGADFDCFAPFGGRRRCCVSDDGTINARYGEPGYTEDGSNGQVMVLQPKFYYRTEPLTLAAKESGEGYLLKKANYYVSPTPKPGFRLHPAFYGEDGSPVDYILLSAYEASYYDASLSRYFVDGTDTASDIDYLNDRLCSLPGKKPVSGKTKSLSRSNAEHLAGARGTGWHIETIKTCAANQLLMMIETGTMDLQSALYKGIALISDQTGANCASLTGSTASLGNGTGTASETVNEKAGVQRTYTDAGFVALSYRGQENPWGNLWKHVNGINFHCESASEPGTVYIADDYDFSDNRTDDNYSYAGFTLPTGNGYMEEAAYGGAAYDWLFLPGSVDGSAPGTVGDWAYLSQTGGGFRSFQYGGRWDFDGQAGPFCCTVQRETSFCSRGFGCRLIFVP